MNRMIAAAVGMFTLGLGSANAADMLGRPVYAVPPVLTSVWTWTGCYIGAHVGGGWGRKSLRDVTLGGAEIASTGIDGWLAGFQIGCDYQAGAWVYGVEGQASFVLGDSSSDHRLTTIVRSSVDYLGTLAVRVGYAWGPTLLYARGGAALKRDSYRLTDAADSPLGSANETPFGWLIGAGFEWAFTPNWSLKFEYSYLDFGSHSVTFTLFDGATERFDIEQHIHTAKVGMNYRFGGPWF
jgi:outer membrane immunogenic protein